MIHWHQKRWASKPQHAQEALIPVTMELQIPQPGPFWLPGDILNPWSSTKRGWAGPRGCPTLLEPSLWCNQNTAKQAATEVRDSKLQESPPHSNPGLSPPASLNEGKIYQIHFFQPQSSPASPNQNARDVARKSLLQTHTRDSHQLTKEGKSTSG